MAKKRVHEIAKERGISSKEVLAVLQKAGLDVKAAASSVDEEDIRRAFSNGADAAPAEAAKQETKTDDGAAKAAPKREQPPEQQRQPKQQQRQEQPRQQRPPKQEGGQRGGGGGPRGGGDGGQRGGDGGQRGGGGGDAQREQRPQRPQRRPEQGGGGGAGGRRRRVVIDSQASRRPQGPPPVQQPPRRGRGRRRRTPWVEPDLTAQPEPQQDEPATQINSGATVKEVAESLGLSAPEVIKKLMELGEMATLTQTLSDEAIGVLADEFEKKIEIVHAADEVAEEPEYEDADADLAERPPVVTIMGHVDHGKTSLLDAIRHSEVVAGEAGGITQHIGAYQVRHNGKVITFLDTPGHQAFTAMRARGAQVTDIAVIVVAADDGVMPQTEEAIDHAKAADVPIMIAVNKIDKEGADPNRVRGELAQHSLTPADWGGDTEFVDVSAKTHVGLEDLLETVVTIAELEELRSNPNTDASGTVIESKLDPGRGPVVTLLVQRGTLKVGDALVAGAHWARVRAMQDFRGERMKHARPGDPVEILGFDGVPEAGEHFRVVENDRRARQLAGERANRLKTEALARRQGVRVSLEDVFARAQEGIKELNLVVKADVAGSLEALEDEIAKLPHDQVAVSVIHDGVGGINESDVMLASASDAIVIGFNVRPVQDAAQIAQREGVEIRTYSVIYRVIEELRAAMEGLLEPEEVETTIGVAEVRATFRASRIGTIAGSYVREGVVRRGASCRLVRGGTIIYDGRIASLRRFQEDAREVEAGFECGIVLENYADVKEEDVIEVYETRQVEREL
jgi:translation initiation factor IF-2